MFRYPSDITFEKKKKVENNVSGGYDCDMCDQKWNTEMDIDIHRKNVHKSELLKALKDENVFMCSICLRTQEDKKTLIEHILVNHLCCPPDATMLKHEVYICNHCNHLFFNKQLLIVHIYHWHTKKTPENSEAKLNCPVCCKTIRTKSAWFHLLHHGALNIGTCPICLTTFDSNDQMIEHVKTHPCLLRCDICNYETTKECYFTNHLAKHKKNVELVVTEDASKYFLPEQRLPSLNNCLTHIFKGIPLAKEVRICVLCRMLVFSVEEMKQHIFAAHKPVEKEKSKVHQCSCGEQFFSSILLKHHIFKMKGDHGVCDGVPPTPASEPQKILNLYQVYEMVPTDPLALGLNDIIITEINQAVAAANDGCDEEQEIRFEIMET